MYNICCYRYGLVEQIDSQLMRIGHDLRDVIEQMNSTSSATSGDDNEDTMNEVRKVYMYCIVKEEELF